MALVSILVRFCFGDVASRVRFFFFQAEDGIRDADVTGVQTCALPIFDVDAAKQDREEYDAEDREVDGRARGGEESRDSASGFLPQESRDDDRLHAHR